MDLSRLRSALRLANAGTAVIRAKIHLHSADQLGRRVRLWGTPVVSNKGVLRIGDNVRLVSTVATLELGVGPEGLLEIGNDVFINYGGSFGAHQLVQIGNRCTIGPHVIMMDNDFHHLEPEKRQLCPPSQPVILEENVWLGARTIVLRGVRIGMNSVIGAGSVVVKDIPPNVVAAGIPARVLRSL